MNRVEAIAIFTRRALVTAALASIVEDQDKEPTRRFDVQDIKTRISQNLGREVDEAYCYGALEIFNKTGGLFVEIDQIDEPSTIH